MSIGDQNDVFSRIKSTMPPWFGGATPILDALIQGLAWAGSFVYSLYAYAKLQTRIKTATDGWLDMIAADFFGTALFRSANQTDASFRARILINLIRERATRKGIVTVLTDLTGRAPKVFEVTRPADTGAYSAPNSGYSMYGGYGSLLLPFQAFVDAYRPQLSGIPFVAGYSASPAGYGVPSQGDYASINQVIGAVQDADLYNAIDSVKPAATIIWTRINS